MSGFDLGLSGHYGDSGERIVDEAMLRYGLGPHLITEDIPLDCPELIALNRLSDEMSQYRRPPDHLVRKFIRAMRKMSLFVERRIGEKVMSN